MEGQIMKRMRNTLGISILLMVGTVLLILAISPVSVHGAMYPEAKVMVLSEDSNVTVTFEGSSASFNNLFGLWSPRYEELLWGHSTTPGTKFDLGYFPSYTELIFFIISPHGTFLNGPGERNPDGVVHAAITDIAFQTWRVGFEDLWGGGDRDYNDITVLVKGDLYIIPPEPQKPDFIILSGDIIFSNTNPTEGDVIEIQANIHNFGESTDSDIAVGFYDGDPDNGGELISFTTIEGIGKEENKTTTIQWDTTGKAGTHNIYVKVDPENVIEEILEDNNKANQEIVVVPEIDLIKIVDITPSAGTELSVGEEVTFDLTVDYSLVSLDQVLLTLSVIDNAGERVVDSVDVSAGSGTVSFTHSEVIQGGYPEHDGKFVIAVDLTDPSVGACLAWDSVSYEVNGALLRVPYFNQGTTDWCVLNSVAMVLQYYGVSDHSWDLAREFSQGHDEAFDTAVDEIIGKKLTNYIENKNLALRVDIVSFPARLPFFNSYIKNPIDAGKPIIIAYHRIGVGGHAVVIVGYSIRDGTKYVYIHDPSGKFFNDADNMFIEVPYQNLYNDLAPLPLFYTFEISGENPNPSQEVIWVEDYIKGDESDHGDVEHTVKDPSGSGVYESYIFLDKGLKYKTSERTIPGFPKPPNEASWLRFLDTPQEGWEDTDILWVVYHISNPHPYPIDSQVCAEIQDITSGETINEICEELHIEKQTKRADAITVDVREIPIRSYYLMIKSDNDEIGPIKINFITPNSIFFIAKSPIDLIVTDPEGLTINKQSSKIAGATYTETDINGDDDSDDLIIIPDQKMGDYLITVTPEPGAEPTDTYTLEVSAGDTTIVLAEDVPISDIPDQPYIIESTEEGIFQKIVDTTPPTIESVTLDAYTTIPDATIRVTVEATDNVGVTSVTADGVALVETGSTWEGNITAPSATGSYTLTIRAEDAAENYAETTVDYSVVKPSGSIGIGVDPRLTTVSAGDTAFINIKLVSTENFDDIAYVYLTTEGVYPGYEANLTWFNWTSKYVKVPAGAVVNVPLEVDIPAGESGYKVFYAKLESTKWTPTAIDTGILYIV